MLREIQAKTILRKYKRVDSWFLSCYGMNLYRGCAHTCVYCDGRAEKYSVAGDFGADVSVKINALELLERELDPGRKRLPMKRSYVMIGGGVGDCYQPAEAEYLLTRRVLELCLQLKHPVHILTKSALVTRDTDILMEINRTTRAMVSFSLSSSDDRLSAMAEPCASPPSERLKALSFLKRNGISGGIYLMPVIPFITDTVPVLSPTIQDICNAGADFVLCSGMTLKDGRQKEYFYSWLKEHYPQLQGEYESIYHPHPYGSASDEYFSSLRETYRTVMRGYTIARQIPPHLFVAILDENDRVAVMLSQMDQLLLWQGKPSPFGYASYSVSRLKEPLSQMKNRLRSIKGVGATTESIIREMIETGTSPYYEKLLRG